MNGNVNASGGYTNVSDYRVKKNIEEITDNIDDLHPVKYFNTITGKQEFGFIAHELQEHFPGLVTGTKDGKEYQSVNYTGLIPLLIKEVQNIKREIEKIKNNK